jgi:hypothetical protein
LCGLLDGGPCGIRLWRGRHIGTYFAVRRHGFFDAWLTGEHARNDHECCKSEGRHGFRQDPT